MIGRRRFITAIAAMAGITPSSGAFASLGASGELRVGLTAVVVREYMRSLNQLSEYLALRIGRPVNFVYRRSYSDIMDMLARGELDAAWVCGYPFVKLRTPEYLTIVVAPLYRGAPLYRSLLIVPKSSADETISDLRGKVFAYSDPDSNSGYLAPRAAIAEAGFDPDQFFRMAFFTYSHAETVQAVARGVANGGAVDSYVYNVIQKYEPEAVAGTRIIAQSRQFGFPPIVARLDLSAEVLDRLRTAFLGMASDPQATPILALFDLDGFAEVTPALYAPIRDMALKAAAGTIAADVRQP